MRETLLAILCVVLSVLPTVQTPTPPPPVSGSTETPPVLSEINRLKILNAIQAVELWTLKVQAAATELQKARTEAEKMIGSVSVPGWSLNDRLEYVKTPKDGKTP